jgi:hypothetical protein
MEKEFAPYEPSFEMKELGFDEPCFSYYKNGQLSGILEEVINSEMRNVNNEIDDYISAPTFSQCFRWFREKYGLRSWIESIEETNHRAVIVNHYGTMFSTYEEAELECLKKLIEIVKNK